MNFVRFTGDRDRAREFRSRHLVNRGAVCQPDEVLLPAAARAIDDALDGPVHHAGFVVVPHLDLATYLTGRSVCTRANVC